jgi:hypothetical protein
MFSIYGRFHYFNFKYKPSVGTLAKFTIVKYVKSYSTKINWTNATTTDYRAVYYDPTFKEISANEM